MGFWGYYKPYVSVAQRKAKAQRAMKKLESTGHKVEPVILDGTKIATTFWGKAWCENLERYSDFSNRLPRGRTYVRNGSVCDLHIEPGQIKAQVCGSELYKIKINIAPVSSAKWKAIKTACAGQIGSLVELLQGKLSSKVMEIVTAPGSGLFPSPQEIELDCSCPDWADMCKHVAAVLYGVGNRLDHKPELLFTLRKVDHLELLDEAGKVPSLAVPKAGAGAKTIAASDLSDVFGIELDTAPPAGNSEPAAVPAKSRKPRRAGKQDQPERAKPGKAAVAGTPAPRARQARTDSGPRQTRARAPKSRSGRQ